MGTAPLNYLICSNPRSGTTLLCDLLAQTGVAGKPDSFFREKSFADWCESWGLGGKFAPEDPDFADRYFDALWAEGRGGTPVFGMRVMGPDLPVAQAWLARRHPSAASDAARFSAEFGPLSYIHLSREDKVAEAVSYVRAEQSGLWHVNADGSVLEQNPPGEEQGYAPDAIAAMVKVLSDLEQTWVSWFANQGVEPLRISYEALDADPLGVLRQVLIHIGQDPGAAENATPGLRKLADDTSAQWIARFKASGPETPF